MELRGESILVTGAAGFLGSHLTERLINLGNNVIAYDNFDKYYLGKEKNLKNLLKSSHFRLVQSSIMDFEKLSSATREATMVFHLAAQPGVRFSMENPQKTNAINVDGTFNVLLAACRHKVKKVIYASSSSVYGIPQFLPCNETHPPLPISIYGASKLAAEKYCETFHRMFKLPIVTLRYHTIYGPRQRPDMAIHIFTKTLFHRQRPIVYGDGNQTRDFTFVSDAVEGTVLAAQSEEANGEVFNIGSGSRTTINETLELLKKLIGRREIPQIYSKSMRGDAPDTQADIQKARKTLAYRPKVRLKEGLEAFVDWYCHVHKPR